MGSYKITIFESVSLWNEFSTHTYNFWAYFQLKLEINMYKSWTSF